MSYWIQKRLKDKRSWNETHCELLDTAVSILSRSAEQNKAAYRIYDNQSNAHVTGWLMAAGWCAVSTEIQQNELITYAQCGTTRLQQLVDLFGEMVQDKSGDPATRIQRIDALADIIRNQLQELQTIATPTK